MDTPVGKLTVLPDDEVQKLQVKQVVTKPVGKLTPVDVPLGADLTRNFIGNHLGVASVDPNEQYLDAQSNVNEDEKQYIRAHKGMWTPEETKSAIDTVAYKDSGFFDSKAYYWDEKNKGLPKIIPYGEKAPVNAQVESGWGNQISAQDDGALTSLAKSTFNTVLDVTKLAPNLMNLGTEILTGEESGLSKHLNNVVDRVKFATRQGTGIVDPQAFNSMSDFFNGENWHPSTNNIAQTVGGITGFLLSMGVLSKALGMGTALTKYETGQKVVGATEKGLQLGEKLTGAEKISNFAKVLGFNSLINMQQAEDAADKAGLEGREKAAMVTLSSVVMGATFMAMSPLARVFSKPTDSAVLGLNKVIAEASVKAFTDAGGKITPEVLQASYEATLDAAKKATPSFLKEVAKQTPAAVATMTAIDLENKALQDIHDSIDESDRKVGEGKYGTKFFSKETAAGALEAAVSGIIMGVGGAGFAKVRGTTEEETKQQNQSIYHYIQAGKTADLISQLHALNDQGKLSEDQLNNALFKIKSYQRYDGELKKTAAQLDDESKQKIFDLSWNDENIKSQIEQHQAKLNELDPTSPVAQGYAKTIEDLGKESKSNIDGIAKILRGTQKDVHAEPVPGENKLYDFTKDVSRGTPEEPAEPTADNEGVTQTAVGEESGQNDKLVSEAGGSPPPVSFKKADVHHAELLAKLRAGEKVEGTVSRGSKVQFGKHEGETHLLSNTGWVLKTPQGEEIQFYSHHGADTGIKENEVLFDKKASLKLSPDDFVGTDGKNYKDNIEVVIDGRSVGNVRKTGDFDKIEGSPKRSAKLTKEQKETQNTEAKGLGFNSYQHAINSYNKRSGKPPVRNYADIPMSELEKVAQERKAKEAKEKPTKREKAIDRIKAFQPRNMEEAILQYFITGGRVNTGSLKKGTGFGATSGQTYRTHGTAEMKQLIWSHGHKHPSPDKIVESLIGKLNTEGHDITVEDANKIVEMLHDYPTKSAMTDRLNELMNMKSEDVDEKLNAHMSYLAEKLGIDEEVVKNLNPDDVMEMEEIKDFNDAVADLDDVSADEKLLNVVYDDYVTDANDVEFDKLYNDFIDAKLNIPELDQSLKIQDYEDYANEENVKASADRTNSQDAQGKTSDSATQGKKTGEGELKWTERLKFMKGGDALKDTKVVDDKGNPAKVYHGTWASEPFDKFHKGDIYFSDNYDTAKMFSINREGGVPVEHIDIQGKPYVMEVVDNDGEQYKMTIAHSDMGAIFPDLRYDVSPEGKWTKGDLGSGFDADAIEYHFAVDADKIDSFTISQRKVSSRTDEYGVSSHYLDIKKPLVIDANGAEWGSGGGDVQRQINNARKNKKYDGVIIKNIVEGGIANPDTKPTTTYVVFDPKQVVTVTQKGMVRGLRGSEQPKASEEYSEGVRKHFAELYPQVESFRDAHSFQEMLDKHFPGQELTPDTIGAAIANTIYIDPAKETQDAQIHEHAHLYWDALPADDSVKTKLLEIFKDESDPEESAIREIGIAGIGIAETSLTGTRLQKFKELLKTFWSKVKALFHVADKDAYARIMADRVWNNPDNIAIVDGAEAQVKFLEKKEGAAEKKSRFIKEIALQKSLIQFNESEHKYSVTVGGDTIDLASVTDAIEGSHAFKYTGKKGGELIKGRGIAVAKYVESLVGGMAHEDAVKASLIDSFMTPEASAALHEHMTGIIDSLKEDGVLIPESRIASLYDGIAGTPDIQVARNDGKVDVYDIKTSVSSRYDKSYHFKVYGSEKGKSKADKDATQLAMYADILKYADVELGRSAVEVNKKGIIPIQFFVDKDGMITDIEGEPIIEIKGKKGVADATVIINRIRDGKEIMEQDEVKDSDILTKKQFAKNYKKERGFDEKANADEIALADKMIDESTDDAEKAQLQKKKLVLERNQQDFEEGYKKAVADVREMKELMKVEDVDSLTHDQLIRYANLLQTYTNTDYNSKKLGIVREHITKRLMEEQGGERGADISFLNKTFVSPSNISDSVPDVQAVVKKKLVTMTEVERVQKEISTELNKRAEAIIKEKFPSKDVAHKLKEFFDPRTSVRDDIFKNLFDPKRLDTLKRWNEQTNNLTVAEREFLKYYDEEASKHDTVEKGYFPKTKMSFWETQQKFNYFRAQAEKATRSQRMNDVKIYYNDPFTKKREYATYKQAVDTLEKYYKTANAFGKTTTLNKLSWLASKTEGLLAKGVNEDKSKIEFAAHRKNHYIMEGGRMVKNNGDPHFKMNKQGELMSRMDDVSDQGLYSRDVLSAFEQDLHDRIYVKKVNPIMPDMLAVTSVYQTLYANKGEYKQTADYLDMYLKKDWMKQQMHALPLKGERLVDNLRAWTFLKVMTWNVPLAIGNILAGNTGTFIHLGMTGKGGFATGWKRFVLNMPKAIAILKHYRVISVDDYIKSESSFPSLISRLSFGLVKTGEYYIQGVHFLAQLSKEQFDAFDKDGNIRSGQEKHQLTDTEIAKFDKLKNDVQGWYEERDKAMLYTNVWWKAAMQFKGWMPAYIKWHAGKYNKDVFGNETKGTLRTIGDEISHLYNQYVNGIDDGWKRNPIDKENWKKSMREAMVLGVALAGYAAIHGTDDERKYGKSYLYALSNLGSFYNLNSYENLADRIMPATGTVKDALDALSSLAMLQQYKSGEKEGDLMAPHKIVKVLPYGNILKGFGVQKYLQP